LESEPLVSGRKRRGEGASAVRKSAKEKGEATQMKKMKTMTMMRMMMRMTMRMMMRMKRKPLQRLNGDIAFPVQTN